MMTVNSLSGGKTSAYMAVHYPADIDVFALVCIDDHNAGQRIDKRVKQMVNDRLAKYCPHHPEFVATAEDPLTLQVIFDLEQKTGREITWLRGIGWEQMLRAKQAIPNLQKRFCTTVLKIIPIFEFCYLRQSLPVQMQIGYRYDEAERQNGFTETIRWSDHCQLRPGTGKWVHRWQDVHWRTGSFPLIADKACSHHVQQYWQRSAIRFPSDSNCQNCFHKQPQQLRKNFDTNTDIMYWAAIQEQLYDHTFRADLSLLQIRQLSIQPEFQFGTGSGCQAGGCTD